MFRVVFWGGERRKLSAVRGENSCAGEVSQVSVGNECVAVKDKGEESGVAVFLSRDVACRVSPFALYSILNLIYIYCAVYQINTVKPAP